MINSNQAAHDLETKGFLEALVAARKEFGNKYEVLMDDQSIHGEKLADRLLELKGRKAIPPEKLSMELWMLRARMLAGQ